MPLAMEVQSLGHWAARKSPGLRKCRTKQGKMFNQGAPSSNKEQSPGVLRGEDSPIWAGLGECTVPGRQRTGPGLPPTLAEEKKLSD